MDYTIDKKSDVPLYMQIRSIIEKGIEDGHLKPGDRLPSVIDLAKLIGVTQATVRRALKDLRVTGHTSCHVGRGTFVQDPANSQDGAERTQQTSHNAFTPRIAEQNNSLEFAARRLRMGVGKALTDIMSLASKPGILQLTKGVPDPQFLSDNFLGEVFEETLARDAKTLYEQTDPLGRYDLRQEIASRFSQENGFVGPDQVLITNGSMQATTLVAQANLDMQYKVLSETPCFKGVTDSFTALGQWVETISRDYEGGMAPLPPREGGANPYLLHLCPYAHNPTGTHLSSERYQTLVDWAKGTSSILVADELFKDLSFTAQVQPSLYRALGPEQTIIISSLSKSIMTGLRLGWIISSRERIQQLGQLKRLMDHSCPTLVQGLAHTIFTSGRYDSHTDKMRTIYAARCEVMMDSLEKYMPQAVQWSIPEGGFSLMLTLPAGYSSVALFLKAIDRGVSFLPGPLFDIDQRFVHCFRISYACIDEEQIKEGVELLSGAVEELLRRPPGDSGLSGLGSFW
ncbi:MAG: 2-aminoadipate transaminase [Desulforhopalus sp.]|jgi:2-aminoadipate transaminase